MVKLLSEELKLSCLNIDFSGKIHGGEVVSATLAEKTVIKATVKVKRFLPCTYFSVEKATKLVSKRERTATKSCKLIWARWTGF